MRVVVKTHGHQYYHEIEGEVLGWVQTVEKYPDNGYFQVPAVIIKTPETVEVVSLVKHLYWTEIKIQKPKGVEKDMVSEFPLT